MGYSQGDKARRRKRVLDAVARQISEHGLDSVSIADSMQNAGLTKDAFTRIGHRLKVRVYSDRLDCYLSGGLVHSTARATHTSKGRGRGIDYRHFIDSLKRKPQAFRGLAFRDDLYPREAYRRTWERLD